LQRYYKVHTTRLLPPISDSEKSSDYFSYYLNIVTHHANNILRFYHVSTHHMLPHFRIFGIIRTCHTDHHRISKDLRIFPISLPQHSGHDGMHLQTFLLHNNMHRHALRHSSTPASLFALIEVYPLLQINCQAHHLFASILQISWYLLIPHLFLFIFLFYSYLLLHFSYFFLDFFVFHVSELCTFVLIFQIPCYKYCQMFVHSCTCSIVIVSE
jgi:hypothetical protein